MKKTWLFVISMITFFSLMGCQKKVYHVENLIEKAREEIPIADADSIELDDVDMILKDDEALIWFVSGNEYQDHYYLPMEFKIVGENEFEFIHTYKPMERGDDIVVLEWKNGLCFLINNLQCKTIKIVNNDGTESQIINEQEQYPFVYYLEDLSSIKEYAFLDVAENEL